MHFCFLIAAETLKNPIRYEFVNDAYIYISRYQPPSSQFSIEWKIISVDKHDMLYSMH